MSAPQSFRSTSFQHRAYLAEAVAQAQLEVEGALLGWDSHEALVDFHVDFALRYFGAHLRGVPELRKGTGAASSRYYDGQHALKIVARDRHVLAYAHELAHALTPGRGNGHHPRWAGAYLFLLGEIDRHSSRLLREQLRALRLTIEKYQR